MKKKNPKTIPKKTSGKITVGVLFGGRSGEHEVSLVSAASVIKHLDKKKYQVVPIGISRSGKFIIKSNPLSQLKAGVKNGIGEITLPDSIIKKIDIFFPIIHGTFGEDGKLQGMLEMLNAAYVGCDVLGSAVGMDKIIQNKLFVEAGLPKVPYHYFLSSEWKKNKKNILFQLTKLGYPLFVKPANLGSSVGISKAHNRGELVKAINVATRYDRKILVEKAVPNAREIEVSVLGNDTPKISVPGEIVPSGEFYDFDAKYVDGQSQAYIPAKISAELKKQIQAMALVAYRALDLSGMARIDFLLDDKTKKPYINEVNTIPGFTSISMYPQLWEASGLSYQKLLDELIALGLKRHNEKNKLLTDFKSGSNWYQ